MEGCMRGCIIRYFPLVAQVRAAAGSVLVQDSRLWHSAGGGGRGRRSRFCAQNCLVEAGPIHELAVTNG
jgi:hypothetical protein